MSLVLPASFADVSNLREVPDHQEVYFSAISGICLIIEVVEYQRDVGDAEAARFFWDDLASDNAASETRAWVDLTNDVKLVAVGGALRALDARVGPLVACGGVQIMPTAHDRAKAARIFLGVVRLPSVGSELVISVSDPVNDDDAAVAGGEKQGVEAEAEDVFHSALSMLAIHDWALFE